MSTFTDMILETKREECATEVGLESINFLMLSTFAGGARQCGIQFDEVLRKLNIDIDMTARPQNRLSIQAFHRIFETCAELASDKGHFPLAVGSAFNFEGLPELGAFVTSAPTLREAFKVFEWSPHLIHPTLYFKMHLDTPCARLDVEVIDPLGKHNDCPGMVEMTASAVAKMCGLMLPGVSILQRVEFKHATQAAQALYERHFGCNVHFNSPHNCMWFASEFVDTPLPGGIPVAHSKAEQLIEQRLLVQPALGQLSNQLAVLLRSKLSLLSEPIDTVASAMNMHSRTLQRKLKLEGVSFAELQSRVRHQLACEMLTGSVLDIESISIKLGYSDRRSFTNAFVKWQGMTPRDFRNHKR